MNDWQPKDEYNKIPNPPKSGSNIKYSKVCGGTNFMDDDYLEIPESMIGQGKYFVLRAKGDYMIDAGIDDGDLVIVKKQNYADDSQIVVAFVNGETTLKRFYRNDEQKLI